MKESSKDIRSRILATAAVLLVFAMLGVAGFICVRRVYHPPLLVSPETALKDLYLQGKYGEVISRCAELENDAKSQGWRLQILYIHWAAALEKGEAVERTRVGEKLIKEFPQEELTADVHLNDALELIAANKRGECLRMLQDIVSRYPHIKHRVYLEKIIANLKSDGPISM